MRRMKYVWKPHEPKWQTSPYICHDINGGEKPKKCPQKTQQQTLGKKRNAKEENTNEKKSLKKC